MAGLGHGGAPGLLLQDGLRDVGSTVMPPYTQLPTNHEAKGIAVTLPDMKFWCVNPLTLQKPRPR